MKKIKYKGYLQVIPSILLVFVLIVIVFSNGIASKKTTEKQAMEYLEETSDRTAEELAKTFLRQEESMQTMAHMTAHIMEYERIDTEKLVHLTETSSFDGIEYIHQSGSCYGMNEQSWNVGEKAYFQDAVQQHVGYAYDDALERSEEGCILFYSPILSDEGIFDGILAGYLERENIESMLDVSFWGHSTKQYLCTLDGTIVATNNQKETNVNILDTCKGSMTEEEYADFAGLLQARDGNFKYIINNKTELGTISDVDDGKFVLIETFPPEVLSELTSPMTNRMHLAFWCVIMSLSMYGFLMFIISRKTKNRLEEENAKVNKLLKGAEGLANHDGLTGLYNRRGMMEAVNNMNLEENRIALLIMDIDFFKQINDNYGHQIGDELLLKVSELLQETFRIEDILVRIGGDEFVVILPNFKMKQANTIKKKVKAINDLLQNPTDHLPAVSVSAGIAFSRPGEKEELFKRADEALYEVKENGRCGCCIYEEMIKEKEL